MANKNLFYTGSGNRIASTDAINFEGMAAYRYTPKHALVQYGMTGCLSTTYYAGAQDQLDEVVRLCWDLDPHFVGQVAVYVRKYGRMKDMPALLCAILAGLDLEVMKKVFPLVIDNGRMLRNFVQIVRSGVVGRKSFGTAVKRVIQNWLENRDELELIRDSIGQSPSLADIIKMVHPKGKNKAREALYGYLIGKTKNAEDLSSVVRGIERELAAFRKGCGQMPKTIPFQMLTSQELSRENWIQIAQEASWTETRMNLNTFQRHGVFESRRLVSQIAERLKNRSAIRAAGVFPYQLLMALKASEGRVPAAIEIALQKALDVALENVPVVDGQIFVCVDVSGSMSSPVTGQRTKGSTTRVQCKDVAALVAAALMRKNPNTEVYPFEEKVVPLRLNRLDSVATNTKKLAALGGGGTNCTAPLLLLNRKRAKGDLVIFVSDNQSWIDGVTGIAGQTQGTEMLAEWERFKSQNPKARLVCIDLQPYGTTQAGNRQDILNIGGFSDQVFNLIENFSAGNTVPGEWVKEVEKVVI